MVPEVCPVHQNVVLVTTPRVEGGLTKWGCAICNAGALEKMRDKFERSLAEATAAQADEEQERAYFETWAKLLCFDLGRTAGAEQYYRSETTANNWLAWLASANMRANVIVEIPLLFANRPDKHSTVHDVQTLRTLASSSPLFRYEAAAGVLMFCQILPLDKFLVLIKNQQKDG